MKSRKFTSSKKLLSSRENKLFRNFIFQYLPFESRIRNIKCNIYKNVDQSFIQEESQCLNKNGILFSSACSFHSYRGK